MVVAVEAPDFISGLDLRERLAPFQASALTGAAGETLVIVENPPSASGLLTTVRDWIESWNVSQVEVRLGPKTYVVQRRDNTSIGWRSIGGSDELDDIVVPE